VSLPRAAYPKAPHASRHPIHQLISVFGPESQETILPASTVHLASSSRKPYGPRPPQAGPHHARDGKAYNGEQEPVLPHPEDGLGILAVPAVPLHDVEEAPAMPFVFIGHQDAHTLQFRSLGTDILLPNHRQEEWAGAVHDRDVRHAPIPVVVLQGVDHSEEEWMLRNRAHGIVADARGDGEADPGWVAEEGIKAAVAAVVQIHVGPSKVREDKVAYGISALNWEWVAVEGVEEPGVFGGDELAGFHVGPEL
jgi:hypothetical protein